MNPPDLASPLESALPFLTGLLKSAFNRSGVAGLLDPAYFGWRIAETRGSIQPTTNSGGYPHAPVKIVR